MVLVVHDERGAIVHIILEAQASVEEMLARYRELGQRALVYDGEAIDIMSCYVVDGEVLPKPRLKLAGDLRAIAADNADTMMVMFEPLRAHVEVLLDGVTMTEADIDDGQLEFCTGHAGRYLVRLVPEFPWLGTHFEIEAEPCD